MALHTWNAAGAGVWSGANWDPSKPVTGGAAAFDNTSDENCTVDETPATLLSLTVAAVYDGDIDLVTFDVTAPTVTLDGAGTFDMGTMTVSNFDNLHQAVFDDGTSTLIFSGDGEWISDGTARTLYNVTINAGITTSVPAASGCCHTAGVLTINGELAIATGEMARQLGGSVVISATGIVSGLGTFSLSNLEAGNGITTQAGTITCAELWWYRGNVASILAPGTYAPTLFRIYNNGAGLDFCRLSAGIYNFDCNVELENTGAGSMTLDCDTNSPTVNIYGDVTITETAVECIFSGAVILVSIDDQAWDGACTTTNPEVEIDKTISGDVTFTNADVAWSASGIDMAGDLTLTSGDFDGASNDPDVTCNALVMDCNALSMGDGDYTVSGAFDIADVTTFSGGTGTLAFVGGSNQAVDAGAETVGAVDIDKTAGTVTFGAGFTTASYLGIQGAVDLNGQTIVATGDFKQVGGSWADPESSDITAGGDVELRIANLEGSGAWAIDATGYLWLYGARVAHLDASATTTAKAFRCEDKGNNTDVSFYAGGKRLGPGLMLSV